MTHGRFDSGDAAIQRHSTGADFLTMEPGNAVAEVMLEPVDCFCPKMKEAFWSRSCALRRSKEIRAFGDNGCRGCAFGPLPLDSIGAQVTGTERDRHCRCGAKIGPKSKTGKCPRCYNREYHRARKARARKETQ